MLLDREDYITALGYEPRIFISAACLKPGSKLIVREMLYNKTRVGFIKTLKSMGGNIKIKNR